MYVVDSVPYILLYSEGSAYHNAYHSFSILYGSIFMIYIKYYIASVCLFNAGNQ